MISNKEYKKEIYFINSILGAIENVKTPMLVYQS